MWEIPNLVFGIYDEDNLVASYRTATHQNIPKMNTALYLILYYDLKYDPKGIEGGIISSVVPSLTTVLEKMCDKYLSFKPLSVGQVLKVE